MRKAESDRTGFIVRGEELGSVMVRRELRLPSVYWDN